ncbi:MAG: WYL domain-containing protein [Fibrobacteraceae bacterium]|nr:WYL domain-containing protein [Fibrobacteraceae bacterium]
MLAKAPKSTYDKLNELKARLSDVKRPATIPELAEFMCCNTRTIFRHLDKLSRENCGLKKTKDSPARYFIQAQMPKRPESLIRNLESIHKLLSDSAEVVQAKTIKKTIAIFEGEEDASAEAINGGINFDDDFVVDLGPFAEFDPTSRSYDALERDVDKFLDAIKHRAVLQVTYEAAHDGSVQTFEVRPLKIVLRIGTLYLVCKDDRDKIKILAIKRIKRFHTTGNYFPDVDFNAKEFYRYCFGKYTSSAGDAYEKMKIVFSVESPWLKAQLREAHFNPPLKIRHQEPMVVELNLFNTPDLKTWLFGILPYIKLQEPSSLKTEMADLLKKAGRAL